MPALLTSGAARRMPQADRSRPGQPSENSEIASARSTLAAPRCARCAGERMVVVGERGHVLLSDDRAKTWRQAKVPTRANAHRRVLPRRADSAGPSGTTRSSCAAKTAARPGHARTTRPKRSSRCSMYGSGTPTTGFAFGAYGTILASTDGGRSWSAADLRAAAAVARPAAADGRREQGRRIRR